MKILVCGGRNYWNREELYRVLDAIHKAGPVTHAIHGGATGADSLVGQWCASLGVECTAYPADWKEYGKAAGPIRNQQMLNQGCPDVVIAFRGGAGTADMVRKAQKAGIKVVDVVKEKPGEPG